MYWVTWAILVIAIGGAGNLSYTDWVQQDVCPKILGIPACYIVFGVFFIAGIMHLINTKNTKYIYFAVMCIPLYMALKGTIIELMGTEICPDSEGGIPMCFISLGFCVSLITAKFFSKTVN